MASDGPSNAQDNHRQLPITIDTAGGNTILMIRSSSMIMFDGFPSLRVAREDEDRRIVGFVVGFKTPTWSKCGLPGPERHPFQPTPWPQSDCTNTWHNVRRRFEAAWLTVQLKFRSTDHAWPHP